MSSTMQCDAVHPQTGCRCNYYYGHVTDHRYWDRISKLWVTWENKEKIYDRTSK